ncbi:MAG: hypothetical protein LRY66_02325 [Saccharospirillaceae bacterium]|nr:hypothetical protein [Saccharospirillaceae bacterium]MCD8530198.1 hypothetical protein [Saccharospirillaceae bacterium]
MLEWLMILIFGGRTIITTDSLYLSEQQISISFDEPITAYNKWATFHVDISQYSNESLEFLEQNQHLRSIFPEGCLKLTLIGLNGSEYNFTNANSALGRNSPTDIWAILSTSENLPKIKYVSARISSCKTFSTAKISWFNYGKI